MANSQWKSEYDELARLARHSEKQYTDDGFTKFFVSLTGLAFKQFDVDIVLTGSSADGSKVDGSDVDVMICPRSITLDENRFEYNEKCPCYFQVRRDILDRDSGGKFSSDGNRKYIDTNTLTGFPVVFHKFAQMNNALCPSKVGYVFSAADRDDPQSKSSEAAIEPHVDFVPAFQISGCQSYMEAWSSRKREWPTTDIVQLIKCGKFHAVAKPSPVNGDEEKDFCLSFTVAEKTLMTSMSDEQLLCMRILKLVRSKLQSLLEHSQRYDKTVHKQDMAEQTTKDIFTSYLFKTALFWISETMNPSSWIDTEGCVYKVLDYFKDCLQRRHLPHYFVPSMNLFTGISDWNIQLALNVMHKFVTSDNRENKVDNASCLDKTSNTSSHGDQQRKCSFTNMNIGDLVKSGYEMTHVFKKRDPSDLELGLTSDIQQACNLFYEFVPPSISAKKQTKHRDKMNWKTDPSSPGLLTLSAEKRDKSLTRPPNEFKNLNSKITNSGKQASDPKLCKMTDELFGLIDSAPRSENKVTNLLGDFFKVIIKTSLSHVVKKGENTIHVERREACDGFPQSSHGNSFNPVDNDSVPDMRVRDVEMDIDLD